MTTMFWIGFIAFLVLLVAFTLRKENEEMPRQTFFERSNRPERWAWLNAFPGSSRGSTLDSDCKTTGTCPKALTNMHRQMPLTHAEKYKLRIIWYWYPSTALEASPSFRSSFS